MSRRGAPSKYREELARSICACIAEGGTLQDASRQFGIAVSTICEWLLDEGKKEFAERYARAREIQADVNADLVVDVSKDRSRDPNCRRVEGDARKWRAAKQNSKYGDKTQTEITGAGGAPLFTEIAVRFVEPKQEGGE